MSNPTTATPPAPDVTLLFGPLLLGVLLNTLLYGILLVQVFIYYHRYRNDRPWFRYLVLYLLIMETTNWVCDIGLIYEPLIVRYATPEAVITSPVMLRPDAVLTVLISVPIQVFIAWRVRVVTRSRILPAFISLFALASLGGGISVTTIVTLRPNFSQFSEFHPEVITWLVASAACDVLLTSSLVFSLWIRKGNVVSTDSYLNKIIRLTVQTGAITAAGSLADLILYIALPGSTMNFLIDFPLSKLYSNSLISTLNARPWREQASKHDAPNVLFEQTANTSSHSHTTFNLAPRRSAYYVRRLRLPETRHRDTPSKSDTAQKSRHRSLILISPDTLLCYMTHIARRAERCGSKTCRGAAGKHHAVGPAASVRGVRGGLPRVSCLKIDI